MLRLTFDEWFVWMTTPRGQRAAEVKDATSEDNCDCWMEDINPACMDHNGVERDALRAENERLRQMLKDAAGREKA